ncbi:MAG TPA: hypothetical protein VGV61_00495, partial [Thermoanaerobaculia bacterium]|nr:hypothetical protein [Thermoanaerobaculia bacterium]
MHRNRFRSTALCLGAFALTLLGTRTAHADDTDFVRKSVEDPYFFVLLDVSGSMNWTTPCSAADLAAGNCRQLCATADCFAPLNADDPASKFYQAKEALYEVLSQVDNINFGFATYNQDFLNVATKHWLYKTTTAGIDLGFTVFPALGSTDVFGREWTCITNDTARGCMPLDNQGNQCPSCDASPARLDTPYEAERVRRFPKLDDDNGSDTTFYIEQTSNATMYEVKYAHNNVTFPAATLDVSVTIKQCASHKPNSCTTLVATKTISFALVHEFISWDAGTNNRATEGGGGFFDQSSGNGTPPNHVAADAIASNTCGTNAGGGWDPNATAASPFGEDLTKDPFNGYNLRFPTTNTADIRGKWFYSGDVLPLDWKNNNKASLLKRLAPIAGGYDQAQYFNDHPQGADNFLRLRDDNNKPLLAFGATPLGDSIKSFRTWYAGCDQGNCPKNTGWKDVAAAQDPNWGCRKKYLIVLTDGDETCGGGNSACNGTASLNAQESIKTYVVAFGVQGGGSTLTCMAANGGTGDPIFPQNKKQLVDALTAIVTQVKEEARAFASAAVPSVEANVKDKIFLSDFTPLNSESVWDGHLDAFLKPLPDPVNGSIPRSPKCSVSVTAKCHLWDAGEVLKTNQAATDANLSGGNYRLGLGVGERRVLYPSVGNTLEAFQPPGGNSEWFDLFQGLGFKNSAATEADGSTPLAANRNRATSIIKNTLRLKTATVNIPNSLPFDITYAMGDIFHSDPVFFENPSNFADFAGDEFGKGLPCDLTPGTDPGYKCFAFKHQLRRKLLIVGANDGLVHAFDAGAIETSGVGKKSFGNGTGLEAFAFIPRMTLPVVRDLAEGSLHIYGVDGPVSTGDVYLRSDTSWHSVAIGGLREGGIKLGGGHVLQPESGGTGSENLRGGYFALDITQPDPLRAITDSSGAIASFEPDISNGGSNIPPTPATAVPQCSSLDGTSTPSGAVGPGLPCPRPFPKLLWEFTDRSPATGQPLDEDSNGDGDLGEPWAKPVLTRVKVRGVDGAGNPIDVVRFVAIVGGGLDRSDKTSTNPAVGNWIYMIDVETGLALYKREVEGAVPAVSALDINFDNICDFVYFGTTAGRVYKIDTRTKPTPVSVNVRDRNGVNASVPRIQAPDWNPLLVFQTGAVGAPQPI